MAGLRSQDSHAQEDIDSGRLVVALDRPWPSRFAYYIVCREESLQRAEVQAFVGWIKDETAADSGLAC
ncbi:LysR substrate-binding domain-containing protein [Pseudomonas shirazensis]|uniref:LysR substrate-binding domain-containing protein n=1 Tax=Pseudomonas shirazensis TaxID=2745494 RepID=UPI003D0510B4